MNLFIYNSIPILHQNFYLNNRKNILGEFYAPGFLKNAAITINSLFIADFGIFNYSNKYYKDYSNLKHFKKCNGTVSSSI